MENIIKKLEVVDNKPTKLILENRSLKFIFTVGERLAAPVSEALSNLFSGGASPSPTQVIDFKN